MANLAELFVLSTKKDTREEITKDIARYTGSKIVYDEEKAPSYIQNRWSIGDFDFVLKKRQKDDFLIVEEEEGYGVYFYGPNFFQEIQQVVYPGDIDDLVEELDSLGINKKEYEEKFNHILEKEDKAIYFSSEIIESKYLKEVFNDNELGIYGYIFNNYDSIK